MPHLARRLIGECVENGEESPIPLQGLSLPDVRFAPRRSHAKSSYQFILLRLATLASDRVLRVVHL